MKKNHKHVCYSLKKMYNNYIYMVVIAGSEHWKFHRHRRLLRSWDGQIFRTGLLQVSKCLLMHFEKRRAFLPQP